MPFVVDGQMGSLPQSGTLMENNGDQVDSSPGWPQPSATRMMEKNDPGDE